MLRCLQPQRLTQATLAAAVLGLFSIGAHAEQAAPAMPQSVDETPFASEREAVIWRQDELKDLERLLRQLRFDLVNNQDAQGAAPRLAELQEKATQAHFFPRVTIPVPSTSPHRCTPFAGWCRRYPT